MTEEDHFALGRHRLPLVHGHEPQALQIAAAEFAQRCERLRSRSEVDRFRAKCRKGLLVEALVSGETAQPNAALEWQTKSLGGEAES